jgi:elongation factor 1-beta
MGNVVMKLRVMPEDVEVDLEALKEKIVAAKPEDVDIRDTGIRPIAFGLKALLIAAVMPDREGLTDQFVESIKGIEGVASVEIESEELL